MNEYQKAKQQQFDDNAKLIEACKLLGFEATYLCGLYTIRNQDGKFIGKMTASDWLFHFRDAIAQTKERS